MKSTSSLANTSAQPTFMMDNHHDLISIYAQMQEVRSEAQNITSPLLHLHRNQQKLFSLLPLGRHNEKFGYLSAEAKQALLYLALNILYFLPPKYSTTLTEPCTEKESNPSLALPKTSELHLAAAEIMIALEEDGMAPETSMRIIALIQKILQKTRTDPKTFSLQDCATILEIINDPLIPGLRKLGMTDIGTALGLVCLNRANILTEKPLDPIDAVTRQFQLFTLSEASTLTEKGQQEAIQKIEEQLEAIACNIDKKILKIKHDSVILRANKMTEKDIIAIETGLTETIGARLTEERKVIMTAAEKLASEMRNTLPTHGQNLAMLMIINSIIDSGKNEILSSTIEDMIKQRNTEIEKNTQLSQLIRFFLLPSLKIFFDQTYLAQDFEHLINLAPDFLKLIDTTNATESIKRQGKLRTLYRTLEENKKKQSAGRSIWYFNIEMGYAFLTLSHNIRYLFKYHSNTTIRDTLQQAMKDKMPALVTKNNVESALLDSLKKKEIPNELPKNKQEHSDIEKTNLLQDFIQHAKALLLTYAKNADNLNLYIHFFTTFNSLCTLMTYPYPVRSTDAWSRLLTPSAQEQKKADADYLIKKISEYKQELIYEDTLGNLPLAYAIAYQYSPEIIKAFLSEPSAPLQIIHINLQGRTVLDIAVRFGNLAAAKQIIQKTLPKDRLPCAAWLRAILTKETVSLDLAQLAPYFDHAFLNKGGDPLTLLMELRTILEKHWNQESQSVIIAPDYPKAPFTKRNPAFFQPKPLRYSALPESDKQMPSHT